MLNQLKNFPIYALLFLIAPAFMSCKTVDSAKNKNTQKARVTTYLRAGLLNSARIQEKFGSFGVEVLAQDSNKGLRLSNLYSLEKGQKIARTIALTQYAANIPEELKAAHEQIIAGGSIGSTLNKHGFEVKKEFFFQGIVTDMPAKTEELMQVQDKNFASIAYDVVVSLGDQKYTYCSIAEVYSPEFLTMIELNQILVNESKAGNYSSKQASPEKVKAVFDELRRELSVLSN